MKELEFRPLSDSEESTLIKLFEINFIGRETLMQQLPGLLAKQIDENGSLQFQVQSAVLSKVKNGPVIEARYPDANTNETNTAHVNILLHVKDGKISMLEVFKDDSSRIFRPPTSVSKFELFTRLPTPPKN